MTVDDREKYYMRWATPARLRVVVDLIGKVYVEPCGITDVEKAKIAREIYKWIENIERQDNEEDCTTSL